MIDSIGIKGRGATLNVVILVAFLQQQLGQIGAVRAGDAAN